MSAQVYFIPNHAIVSMYAFDAFSECPFDARVFSCIIELNPPDDPGGHHDPGFIDEESEPERATGLRKASQLGSSGA